MSEPHSHEEEARKQVDPACYCAHQTVKYDPIDHGNGTFTSRWRCKDCKLEFTPGKLIDRLVWAAFPEIETMRDKFAMAALTGITMSPEKAFDNLEDVARGAYLLASAMLEARK